MIFECGNIGDCGVAICIEVVAHRLHELARLAIFFDEFFQLIVNLFVNFCGCLPGISQLTKRSDLILILMDQIIGNVGLGKGCHNLFVVCSRSSISGFCIQFLRISQA